MCGVFLVGVVGAGRMLCEGACRRGTAKPALAAAAKNPLTLALSPKGRGEKTAGHINRRTLRPRTVTLSPA